MSDPFNDEAQVYGHARGGFDRAVEWGSRGRELTTAASSRRKGNHAFLVILRLGEGWELEPPRESLQLENLEPREVDSPRLAGKTPPRASLANCGGGEWVNSLTHFPDSPLSA